MFVATVITSVIISQALIFCPMTRLKPGANGAPSGQVPVRESVNP